MDEVNLKEKSNCANTLRKFYKSDVETVTKLRFYDINNRNTIYNMGNTNDQMKENKNKIKAFNLPSITKSNFFIHNESSFRCDDRLENMNFEASRESKRSELEKDITVLKTKKANLKEKLKDLDCEINNLSLEVEVLANHSKYYKYGYDKRKRSSDLLLSNLSISSINTPSLNKSISEKEQFEKIARKLQKFEDFREAEKKKKIGELKEKERLKYKFFKEIEELNTILINYKEELSHISNELIMHYHKVLTVGKDTRQEGLVWIIKSIWSLKENVLTSYLPQFLDELCITYLFEYAKLSLNLMKLKRNIEELNTSMNKCDTFVTKVGEFPKSKSKLDQNRSCGNLNSSTIQFFEPIGGNKKFKKGSIISLRKMLRNASVEDDNLLSIKNFNGLVHSSSNKARIVDNTVNSLKEIKELQVCINDLKLKMERLRSKELQRINKEFLINDYQRRFNVTQEEVISAIVGEDNTMKEYAKLLKDQKEYYEKIKICRSFNFIEKNKYRNSPS